MASQPSTARKSPEPEPHPGYLEWSRDPAVGLLVVMPLWAAYELLRVTYVPHQMNKAEHMMSETLQQLPGWMLDGFRIAMFLGVLLAARSIAKREIPWLRVGLVILLEGAVYGLMLGPIGWQMTRHLMPLRGAAAGLQEGGAAQVAPETSGSAQRSAELIADLIGSLGAGVYEELMFRLVLLSVLVWLFFRVAKTFGMPRWVGAAAAVLVSSLLFALFHYGLPNALAPKPFTFRTVAGCLLGLLFVFRGIGVCVYTHAMYDVFLYLNLDR